MLVSSLKTRPSSSILEHLKTGIRDILPSLHFHSGGEGELVASEVLAFLHSAVVTTFHSPRDTSQMNSVKRALDLHSRGEGFVDAVAFTTSFLLVACCSLYCLLAAPLT